VLVRDGKLKFLELKSATGRITPEQFEWDLALRPNNWRYEYRVVRPADLDDVIASLR
jgi:hypothetical protein